MPPPDLRPAKADAWLGIGRRAFDAAQDRLGVVQLFRDSQGGVNTGAPSPAVAQVLLRPVDNGVPWWARIDDLAPPSEERDTAETS